MSAASYVGQRLSFESQLCTVRYVGDVKGTKGEWLGVEWDDPTRGKHSGEHNGTEYFKCRRAGAGSFVRPNRPHDPPKSFLEGIRGKYIADVEASGIPEPIIFGTKRAEEVGFDKISKKFSELDTLRAIILDFEKIKYCDNNTDEITETCASARELNISCNLFEDFQQVANICCSIQALDKVSINGNRFSGLKVHAQNFHGLNKIRTLKADDLLLTWPELFSLLDNFTGVVDLSIAVGDLTKLTPAIAPRVSELQIASCLQSLCLEEHAFEYLSDLADLQNLPRLRRLLLSRNNIKTMYPIPSSQEDNKLHFPEVVFLDVSVNRIDDWVFLDDIRVAFPKLDALRISQNPLYGTDDGGTLSEAAYQITIGRLRSSVSSLNYSGIKAAERADAELFYISTIVKELSEKPVEQEAEILSRHTRWQELQFLHGEQTIDRELRQKSKDALVSKLIEVEATYGPKTITKKFPRTVTIGKLSGLIGRLFGANPLDITLCLVEDNIVGDKTVRETLLADELRELDYYVIDTKARISVKEK
ncbi:hypothetical protein H072_5691 [Dactylellina haptotyla CBS 200.50]|uniref:Tubulin-specific chaperone E n=1 Tax=Dactylellina haptotyla (strain CBS 200.50) TaxID=1284197 RepID=S8BYN6_DACHA|nr:hypothetical protein H072_5691 [Dactylellina haptotyla CBS 200.50]